MSVLLRMNSFNNSFSIAEKKINAYIQKNPEKAVKMTAKDLALATNVSAPTIVRFSQKIGYSSLTDFKIQLSTELQSKKQVPSSYSDVNPNESFHSIKQKIGTNAQMNLEETISFLDEQSFDNAIKIIESAPIIFTFGVGASALAAQDIAHKWSRIGQFVLTERDIHLLIPQIINAPKHSVLWLISNSGKTPELLSLAELAIEHGITILTLTQFGQNPLQDLAEVALRTARPIEAENRSAATNSILSQFLVIDVLFYLYISKNHHYFEQIRESKEAIKEYKSF